jgi:hypothetical protein
MLMKWRRALCEFCPAKAIFDLASLAAGKTILPARGGFC